MTPWSISFMNVLYAARRYAMIRSAAEVFGVSRIETAKAMRDLVIACAVYRIESTQRRIA